MTNVWVRPIRPEDVPTLKAWLEEQQGSTPFNVEHSTGAQILVVYDDDGIMAFVPFRVSLTAGCPLRRGGLKDWTDDHQADGFRAAVRAMRFIADAQGVREINAGCGDKDTESELAACGFAAAGKFMRQRR